MEKLALSVWVALLFGASVGVANDQRATLFEGYPTVPVPAGNTLAEARIKLGKGILHDLRASASNQPACSACQEGRLLRALPMLGDLFDIPVQLREAMDV